MTLRFGPFELDEAGRALMCARQEMPLQPRVFDLLVYLTHNRNRVIAKDSIRNAAFGAHAAANGETLPCNPNPLAEYMMM